MEWFFAALFSFLLAYWVSTLRTQWVVEHLTEKEMIDEIKRRRWTARSKQLSDDKVDQEMRQL